MIRIAENRWVHEDDLARDILGREDDPDTVEACISYLEGRQLDEEPSFGSEAAFRAGGELIAARVRRAASERLTIDRLLAFVPTRMRRVSDPRMSEITNALVDRATRAFSRAPRIIARIANETDPDSEAAQRLTLSISATDEDDSTLGDATLALHRALAELTSPEEFRAIRLVIELR